MHVSTYGGILRAYKSERAYKMSKSQNSARNSSFAQTEICWFWRLYWTILGNAASVTRRTRYVIPPSDITSCFWFVWPIVWPAPRFGQQRSHLLKWTSLTVQSQQSSSYEESPLWSVWAASLSSFRNDWYFSRSSEVNIFSSSSESKSKRGKRGRAAELLLINSTESRVTLRHE